MRRMEMICSYYGCSFSRSCCYESVLVELSSEVVEAALVMPAGIWLTHALIQYLPEHLLGCLLRYPPT